MTRPGTVLWTPPPDAREKTRLGRFLARVETARGTSFDDYESAWRWSVEDLEGFWSTLAEFLDVSFHHEPEQVLGRRTMPGAEWFPGATLNYAEHVLRAPGVSPDDTIVWSLSQTRPMQTLTVSELRAAVAACRTGLRDLGVGMGDVVAAYLPNIAETFVAFLATASLGAVWVSCPPEFGTRSVLDRFGQVEPVVLLTVDGYGYGDKVIDRRAEVAAIRESLPSLRHTVVLPYARDDVAATPEVLRWSDLVATSGPLEFVAVPFDHPLYVLYSSGTTGLPKAIIHGHGGILIEHLKCLALHSDLGPGDRFFWFSTTGWMMWNYLVSGPAAGAGIVLYDGDPAYPHLDELWRVAEELRLTYFGTSAPFLMSCRKAGLRPGDNHDLSALRSIGSTGAPLPAEGFEWVYDAVSSDVLLSSVSGGTDVCTAFVGGCPLVPVRSGEISCRYLGVNVEAFDTHGRSLVGQQGELVITEPMPSMPVGYWGDDDGSRYRAAYFGVFPGVWRHGDWITINENGSCVISGRSDSTLNRGGVRLGTSEFYAVVEDLPEIADSVVVHVDDASGEGMGELRLFIVLTPGAQLDDGLRQKIGAALRSQLSPRHVPDRIEAVPAVPRTLSGKKLEVPVKRILAGVAPEVAASRGALADAAALDAFVALAHRGEEGAAASGTERDASPRSQR